MNKYQDLEDHGLLWELIKMEIRAFTISYSKQIAKTKKDYEEDLLLYGKLGERAVCSEFCVLIGYPSGQDGAILPARDCPFRSRK